MNSKVVKIQEATGLIRKAPVDSKSHKFKTLNKKAGRSTRSTGIYAEKHWDGSIRISFNLNNYSESNMQMADSELIQFAEFATSQGYSMTQISRWDYKIEIA